jgi:hypothetical protein
MVAIYPNSTAARMGCQIGNLTKSFDMGCYLSGMLPVGFILCGIEIAIWGLVFGIIYLKNCTKQLKDEQNNTSTDVEMNEKPDS